MTCWKKRKKKRDAKGAVRRGERISPGVLGNALNSKKVSKGVRRMPWLSEAKKDVISCDKLWGGANDR